MKGHDMGEKKPVPRHVAVIMDGNGRWAELRGVSKLEGHHAGMNSMKEIIKKADTMGIKYLTVYAFSTENWKRSREEVGGIFNLLVKYMAIELKEMNEKNMKVNIFGDWQHRLPEDAIEAVRDAVVTTADNTGLVFNICLNYGSRDEITRAVNKLLNDGRSEVTEDDISAALYSGERQRARPRPDHQDIWGGETFQLPAVAGGIFGVRFHGYTLARLQA